MPKDNNTVIFQTVDAFIGAHGSSGSREYTQDALFQNVHLFRWKHLDIAREILLQPDLLQEYAFDGAPRDLFGIGDSTPTFNDINNTLVQHGKAMGTAYAARKSTWANVTNSLIVIAKDGAKQIDILALLQNVIEKMCQVDPRTFRGHLLLLISANDVHRGKEYVPDHKLDETQKICASLALFPVGSVSVIGPGSETNWHFPAGTFTHLAESYFQLYVNTGHPVYNPEHVYGRMEMNQTMSHRREPKPEVGTPGYYKGKNK